MGHSNSGLSKAAVVRRSDGQSSDSDAENSSSERGAKGEKNNKCSVE